MSKDSIGKTAARSLGWAAADKWGTRFTSLVVLLVLGRLLPPSSFGLLALASTCVGFAGLFVDQSFGKALIQRPELRPEHADTAFWTAVGLAGVLTASVMLGAPFLARLTHSPDLTSILRWISLGIFIQALSSTPAALLERNFDFRSLALRRISGTFIGGIAALVVAFAGGGVWSLVIQTITTAVAGLFVLWAATDWRPGARYTSAALRELWPIGIAVFGIEFIALVNSQADRFIIGAFLSATDLGLYFMAMRLISVILELFSSIFASISLAVFSRLQNDRERLLQWFLRLIGASTAVALPCFVCAAILAPRLLPLLLGPGWVPAIPILQALTCLGAIQSALYFDRSLLLALGYSRIALLMTLGQCVLGLVLVFFAVSHGVLAVAFAVVARQLAFLPVRLWILRRTVGLAPMAYLGQWLRPLLASAFMLLALWQFFALWPLTNAPLTGSVLAACIGLCVYAFFLRLFHRDVFADLRSAALSSLSSLRLPRWRANVE